MRNLYLKIHKNSQTHILTAETLLQFNNILNYHSPEQLNKNYYIYYINSEITLLQLYSLTDFLTENHAKFKIIFN